MAYDQELAHRIRAVLAGRDLDPVERQMFGGLAFMVRGHMTVGVMGDELMVRVGKAGHEEAVGRPHARVMDFTGRPMRSMVVVAPAGFDDDADLEGWVGRGLAFTTTLAPK